MVGLRSCVSVFLFCVQVYLFDLRQHAVQEWSAQAGGGLQEASQGERITVKRCLYGVSAPEFHCSLARLSTTHISISHDTPPHAHVWMES
jgi:hypothetical protein